MDKDVFDWTRRVGCPSELLNDSVKRMLCEGLSGLLWDEMSKAIFSANEVTTIRKNILLHKLQKNKSDTVIQCIREISQLKLKTSTIDAKISVLEQECEERNFLFRKKVQRMKKIKSQQADTITKKHLLRMRYNEAQTQINDCANMRFVCKKIMPSTEGYVDKDTLQLCLNKITTLEIKASTKEVWNEISNILGPIQTNAIWAQLIHCQSEELTKLTKLNLLNEANNSDAIGEQIEIGIARARGQHVHMISKKLLHNARTVSHQRNLMELIDTIEMAASNSSDISEWLALALEVQKLEIEQAKLQDEVDNIKAALKEGNTCSFRLAEITSDIRQIDSDIEKYVQDIKESIIRLKSASLQIMAQRDKLNYELQKIFTLGTNNHNMEWLHTRLNTELNIFHDTLNINVLRKIMLKGEVGSYRHISSCLSEASIFMVEPEYTKIMTHFPMIQIPIYTLIDCYKEVVTRIMYKRFEISPAGNTELAMLTASGQDDINHNVLDLLDLTRNTCNNAREEIQHFYSVLKAWTSQNIQEVLSIVDKKIVDGATFKEWIQRYGLLLYMIESSK